MPPLRLAQEQLYYPMPSIVSRFSLIIGGAGGLFDVICRPVGQLSTFRGYRLNFCNHRVTDREEPTRSQANPRSIEQRLSQPPLDT